ncbi:MAG: nitroreductase family deazaflavin-dependent oxidoreductase [Ktedonobacteraceae bacterium]
MSTTSQPTQKNQVTGVGKSLQRLFMKGHVSLYRLTGGKVGGGEHLLILTTVGRKSGLERDTPLFFFRDGDRFIIIASAGGAPKHPIWWLNLQGNPQAKVQVGPRVIPVTARRADGEERTRLWSIIAENYKNFVGYQKHTTREIPVVILTPTV